MEAVFSLSQKTSRSIVHVRYIKILTGLRGFNCKYFKIPLSEETWTQRNPNQVWKNDPTASEWCKNFNISNVDYSEWTKVVGPVYTNIFKFLREIQQQLRRRLRKRHLKSEFALLQTLSRLFQLVQFVKCWQIVLELNSKRLQSSGKEEEKSLFCFHVLDKTWN